jgi:mono/diheme cytochrome c family protein
MKKLLFIPLALFIGLLFMQGKSARVATTGAELPDNVKAVVDKKCYGCHNANSKNEKAKGKLDWDAVGKMKKSKRMAAMDKISEMLAKGEMPPKKFLENKPEGALTAEELATLVDWSAGKKKKSK